MTQISWHFSYDWGKPPGKTFKQKIYPIGDRTLVRCVRCNDVFPRAVVVNQLMDRLSVLAMRSAWSHFLYNNAFDFPPPVLSIHALYMIVSRFICSFLTCDLWVAYLLFQPAQWFVFWVHLRWAMGEISNLYIFPPRLFIFGTQIPPIITIHAAKFHWFL